MTPLSDSLLPAGKLFPAHVSSIAPHRNCPSTGMSFCFCRQESSFGSLNAAVLHRLNSSARRSSNSCRDTSVKEAVLSVRKRRFQRRWCQLSRRRELLFKLQMAVCALKSRSAFSSGQGGALLQDFPGSKTPSPTSSNFKDLPKRSTQPVEIASEKEVHHDPVEKAVPPTLVRGAQQLDLTPLMGDLGIPVAEAQKYRAESRRKAFSKNVSERPPFKLSGSFGRRCVALHARGAAKAAVRECRAVDNRDFDVISEQHGWETIRNLLPAREHSFRVKIAFGHWAMAEPDDPGPSLRFRPGAVIPESKLLPAENGSGAAQPSTVLQHPVHPEEWWVCPRIRQSKHMDSVASTGSTWEERRLMATSSRRTKILQSDVQSWDLLWEGAARHFISMWFDRRAVAFFVGPSPFVTKPGRRNLPMEISSDVDSASSRSPPSQENDSFGVLAPSDGRGHRDVTEILGGGKNGCIVCGLTKGCPINAETQGDNRDTHGRSKAFELEFSASSFRRRKRRLPGVLPRVTATASDALLLQENVTGSFFPPLLPVVFTHIKKSIFKEREHYLRKRQCFLSRMKDSRLHEKTAFQGTQQEAEEGGPSKSCTTEGSGEEAAAVVPASTAAGVDAAIEGEDSMDTGAENDAPATERKRQFGDASQQRFLEALGVSRLLEGEEDDFVGGRSELWCHYRHCRKDTDRKELLLCIKCRRAFHASCCDPPLNYEMVTRFPWQCTECKTCELCGSNKNEDTMLICDACDRAYHMECMRPPVGKIPEGDWFCPACGHCHCCGRELSDAEALDSSCFYSNQRRICPECKETFSDFIAAQGLMSSLRATARRQESQTSSRRVKQGVVETTQERGERQCEGEASKPLYTGSKLCVVCIKPLNAGQCSSQAGGREKLNASVVCAECKQGAHVRCCESMVKRQQGSGARAATGPTTIVCNTCVRIRNDFCVS